jgi:hypothetical protein
VYFLRLDGIEVNSIRCVSGKHYLLPGCQFSHRDGDVRAHLYAPNKFDLHAAEAELGNALNAGFGGTGFSTEGNAACSEKEPVCLV